jgi:hypothetical protein
MEDEIPHLLVFRTVMTIYFLSNVERNIFEQIEGRNTSWKLIPYASMLRSPPLRTIKKGSIMMNKISYTSRSLLQAYKRPMLEFSKILHYR